MIELTLPGKPESTNQLYRYGKRGMYMTQSGKNKKKSYIWEARKQYDGDLLEKKLSLEIELYFPDKRRRDIDNYLKIVLDALEGEVFVDDRQIYELSIEKNVDCEEARTEVTVDYV